MFACTLLDILALDILGLDILGLDILGLDILGMTRVENCDIILLQGIVESALNNWSTVICSNTTLSKSLSCSNNSYTFLSFHPAIMVGA